MSIAITVTCPECKTSVTAPGVVVKCPWCGFGQTQAVRQRVREMAEAFRLLDCKTDSAKGGGM